MKKTTVSTCVFKRSKKSKMEKGIMVGEGDLIIDGNLKTVRAPVWSYSITWMEGTLKVEIGKEL